MSKNHDPASESYAQASTVRPSGAPTPLIRAVELATGAATGADSLVDVLHQVKLSGVLFFRGEGSSPWRVDVPHANALAPIILPRARHIISYHIITRGSCWASLDGQTPIRLETGDVLVAPHGDPYAMMIDQGDSMPQDPETALGFFRRMAAEARPFTIIKDEGESCRLNMVCGFLGCDTRPFNPLLATLPRLLRVSRLSNTQTDLLDKLIDLTLSQSREPGTGSEAIRLRLSELMFIEVVRRHLSTLPAGEHGWLAGLRDPTVGRALTLLHAQPAHPWTLEELANQVSTSRSTLADRFTDFIGQPPMQYLTQWRMQVAARLLADSGKKVASIAFEVGYASEAAFSRSFKKATGTSPMNWRRTTT